MVSRPDVTKLKFVTKSKFNYLEWNQLNQMRKQKKEKTTENQFLLREEKAILN